VGSVLPGRPKANSDSLSSGLVEVQGDGQVGRGILGMLACSWAGGSRAGSAPRFRPVLDEGEMDWGQSDVGRGFCRQGVAVMAWAAG